MPKKTEEKETNKVQNYIDTVISIITKPSIFFKNLKKTTGYKDSIIFLIITASILVLENFTISGLEISNNAPEFIGWTIGCLFIFVPICLIGFLIHSASTHITLKLLGSKKTYETTFKAISFSSAANIFSIIPVIGFFFFLYMIYLMIIALSELHNLSKIRIIISLVCAYILLFIIMMLILALIL